MGSQVIDAAAVSLFGRYSNAPSSLVQRAGGTDLMRAYSDLLHTKDRTQTLTVGANATITPQAINEFHFKFSLNRDHSFVTLDNFGGADPVKLDSIPIASIAEQRFLRFLWRL
jgi:hypothetical protein